MQIRPSVLNVLYSAIRSLERIGHTAKAAHDGIEII